MVKNLPGNTGNTDSIPGSRISSGGKFPGQRSLVGYSLSSVAQSCLTLCDPKDCSMPGFPVHHQLLELTQTHVHWVGDATQPSHPLSSPLPPAFSLSQYQGLFQWVNSSHQGYSLQGRKETDTTEYARAIPKNTEDYREILNKKKEQTTDT